MSNPKFQKVRSVTQSVLKIANGQPRYVFALAPMYQGEKIDDKKEPAILLPVVDMETGEEGVVICPAVLQSELVKAYGVDGYVAKGFELVKTRDPEKKYNHVAISEVAAPDDFKPPAAPKPAAAAIKAAADTISAAIAAKSKGTGKK